MAAVARTGAANSENEASTALSITENQMSRKSQPAAAALATVNSRPDSTESVRESAMMSEVVLGCWLGSAWAPAPSYQVY